MTIAQLTRRLRGAWNHVAASLDRMILKMALDSLNTLVGVGSAAADRLIAKGADDATARADLQTQVDNFEQDAIAEVQPLVDKLTSAAPEAPAPDPTV